MISTKIIADGHVSTNILRADIIIAAAEGKEHRYAAHRRKAASSVQCVGINLAAELMRLRRTANVATTLPLRMGGFFRSSRIGHVDDFIDMPTAYRLWRPHARHLAFHRDIL